MEISIDWLDLGGSWSKPSLVIKGEDEDDMAVYVNAVSAPYASAWSMLSVHVGDESEVAIST